MNQKKMLSYAQGLLAALADWDGDERFDLDEIEVANVPCLLITCQDKRGEYKPVALILAEGLNTVGELCEAAVAQDAAEAVESEGAEEEEVEDVEEFEEAPENGNGAEHEEDPAFTDLLRRFVKEVQGKVTRRGKAKPPKGWSP